ncbi:MAG: hypothetical protein K6G26_06970 [Lachnospiraceae bacterium]|nr:hypothetical protein [Lachnospiraceae bacterium]
MVRKLLTIVGFIDALAIIVISVLQLTGRCKFTNLGLILLTILGAVSCARKAIDSRK